MRLPENFYCAGSVPGSYERHIPAPYIRGSFTVGEGAAGLNLAIGATGFYRLFINGKELTRGLLSPYICNPDHFVFFDEYDISGYVQPGRNTVGVMIGNGMANCPGGRVWDFDMAVFRSVPAFALAIEETDKDGCVKRTEADSSFLWRSSPVIFDDLRSGCFYNAQLEITGWAENGLDTAGWKNVSLSPRPRGELILNDTDPIAIRSELTARKIDIRRLSKDFCNRENMRLPTELDLRELRGSEGYCFDFGVNTAGIVRLTLRNPSPGQRIIIRFCEMMDENGEISDRNTGSFYPDGYGQTAVYIARGGKKEVFEPCFTYFGFRYALVWGLSENQLGPDTLVCLEASSKVERRAGFESDDPLFNRLWEISERSDLSNLYYFPTDCPHREKNGWTGDAACSAEHLIMEYTSERTLSQWLACICRAQRPDGRLPGIVPTDTWGIEWGNGPAWDNALPEICYRIYMLRGDLEPAGKCAESLLRYLSYISSRRGEDGLIAIGLGDWVQPGHDASRPDAPLRVTDTLISMDICRKCAVLFKALNKPLHLEFAEKLQKEFRAAFRANCIDFDTMTVESHCETAQAMAVYYGAFDCGELDAAYSSLEAIVREQGGLMNVGMLGTRTLLHALSAAGRKELAVSVVRGPTYPSYGHVVELGLTSMPETFLPRYDRGDPGSLNHHFFCDVTGWMLISLAGINVNPGGNDPSEIELSPYLPDGVGKIRAYYIAPAGRIDIELSRLGERVKCEVTADRGVTVKARPDDRTDITVSVR